jgi:hypothetical protein
MPIPLGVDRRTFAFEQGTDRKTSLFRDRPEGVRLNDAWMWVAAWLIATSDFRIDLLFTMSDNKALPVRY